MKTLILALILITATKSACTVGAGNCDVCGYNASSGSELCVRCKAGYTVAAAAGGACAQYSGDDATNCASCDAATDQTKVCAGAAASAACTTAGQCAGIANCINCAASDKCAKCDQTASNKLLNVAGDACVATCPSGEIANTDTTPVCIADCSALSPACTTVQKCAEKNDKSASECVDLACASKKGCTACNDTTEANCDACDTTQYAFDGTDNCVACSAACAQGEVCELDSGSTTAASCVKATCMTNTDNACKTCNDPDDLKCATCEDDAVLLADKSACKKCEPACADGETCEEDATTAGTLKCVAGAAEASSGLLLSAIALISAIVLA